MNRPDLGTNLVHGRRVHDIGMPIREDMWCYRAGWENRLETIASTSDGDASTVYRFNLCSHTGTYIETSQHKLNNDITLEDFGLEAFVRTCKLIRLVADARAAITLDEFQAAMSAADLELLPQDALIVMTGWGMNHRSEDYLKRSPFFSPDLVDFLCRCRLGVLGVDVPAIDNLDQPYGAVTRLFEAHERMLLLAPLVLDPSQVNSSGSYLLVAAPLNIADVSASLCRPLLLEPQRDESR